MNPNLGQRALFFLIAWSLRGSTCSNRNVGLVLLLVGACDRRLAQQKRLACGAGPRSCHDPNATALSAGYAAQLPALLAADYRLRPLVVQQKSRSDRHERRERSLSYKKAWYE